jgi:hypothetical protein
MHTRNVSGLHNNVQAQMGSVLEEVCAKQKQQELEKSKVCKIVWGIQRKEMENL